MRDMNIRKFEVCCRGNGFDPVPDGTTFVSLDGATRVPAAMHPTPLGMRIHRRGTLVKLAAAKRQQTANSEAPGAATPRASVDPSHQRK